MALDTDYTSIIQGWRDLAAGASAPRQKNEAIMEDIRTNEVIDPAQAGAGLAGGLTLGQVNAPGTKSVGELQREIMARQSLGSSGATSGGVQQTSDSGVDLKKKAQEAYNSFIEADNAIASGNYDRAQELMDEYANKGKWVVKVGGGLAPSDMIAGEMRSDNPEAQRNLDRTGLASAEEIQSQKVNRGGGLEAPRVDTDRKVLVFGDQEVPIDDEATRRVALQQFFDATGRLGFIDDLNNSKLTADQKRYQDIQIKLHELASKGKITDKDWIDIQQKERAALAKAHPYKKADELDAMLEENMKNYKASVGGYTGGPSATVAPKAKIDRAVQLIKGKGGWSDEYAKELQKHFSNPDDIEQIKRQTS